MSSRSPRAGTPLTRDDWADAALDALAHGGLNAVAVEPIARELGVTKGSFYHHFSGREELLEAALGRWEERGTEAVLGRVAQGASPRERLERLFLAAFETTADARYGPLLTHLAASAQHPLVGPALDRVTRRRLEWLRGAWEQAGLARIEAERRALLAYTAYLGMVQLRASAPEQVPRGEALKAYVRQMVDQLVP